MFTAAAVAAAVAAKTTYAAELPLLSVPLTCFHAFVMEVAFDVTAAGKRCHGPRCRGHFFSLPLPLPPPPPPPSATATAAAVAKRLEIGRLFPKAETMRR